MKPAERGAALVIALLIMGVLLLLGTAFMTISATETQIASNERNAVQAFYLADAGLNKTISDLNAGAVCSSLSDVLLPQSNPVGTFTRTVTLGASLDERIIESTGYVPNATSANKAQAKVKVTLKGSLFNMALFARGTDTTGDPELDIGPNSLVDSYDSSQGAYNPSAPGTKAEIGSNGNIRLKSGATVKCSAFKRVSINKESGATVTGIETLFPNPVTLPSVAFTFPSGSNVTVGNNDTVTLTPASFPAYYGKLDVGQNGTIVLSCSSPPCTYSFDKGGSDFSIKMEQGSTLRVTGQVEIYINGKLDVKKEAKINWDGSPGLPTNLLIYSSFSGSGGVSSDKDLKFFGAIYAPDTGITTQKDSEIYGSLIGRTVDLAQDNKVHFDAALLKLAPGGPYKPKAGTWQEVLPSS